MNDYPILVRKLRELDPSVVVNLGYIRKAADAIEQLAKERDAAVAEIPKHCGTCKHNYVTPMDYSNCDASISNCKWEWRGVRDE